MSKFNSLLWAANIEILHGLFHPAKDLNEVLSSGKTQTVHGLKGSIPGTLRMPSDEEMDNYFKTAGLKVLHLITKKTRIGAAFSKPFS